MSKSTNTLNPTTLVEALKCIINTQGGGANLSYAQSYARVALQLLNAKGRLRPHNHTQLLYVRNNLSHWRAPHAKAVRALLDKEIKELEAQL